MVETLSLVFALGQLGLVATDPEREQRRTLSGIFWPWTFLLKQRGDKEYFEVCCFMTASPLYMQQLWWCPPQWWWLVVQGTWIFRIFGSSPGLVKHLLSLPLLVLESQRYSKQTMWKYVFQICDQVSFSQLLIWSKLTFSLNTFRNLGRRNQLNCKRDVGILNIEAILEAPPPCLFSVWGGELNYPWYNFGAQI